MRPEFAKQLENAPRGNSNDRAGDDSKQRYLKSKARQINKDMAPFLKCGTAAANVNSSAFAEGWERIFGSKKEE